MSDAAPLPRRLDEWLARARSLGTGALTFRRDFEHLASSLPEGVIEELGRFYARAHADRDVHVLATWLAAQPEDGPAGDDETAIRNLVILFGHLGQRGWRPFNDYWIKDEDLPSPRLNWKRLPPDLAFLAEPAIRARAFTYSFSDAGREHVRRSVAVKDRADWAAVADRVRAAGSKRISQWARDMGVAEHAEASLVFNLLAVLDALGLPYHD